MTTLTTWAQDWGIPENAIQDLRARLQTGIPEPRPEPAPPGSEAATQAAERLRASKAGDRLWRNNNGALTTVDGRFMRFGLCNDSARVNKVIKSSDLIGIKEVDVMPEHVGRTFGLFYAREMKHAQWVYKGTAEEKAQLKFIELVLSLGGDASFSTGP